MKNKINIFINHIVSKVLIILLFLCLTFIALLIYTDYSPSSLFNSVLQNISSEPKQFDNSNLYTHSEPIDHLESVNSILNVLKKPDTSSAPETDIGIDVTDRFINYTTLVSDFSNLSNLIASWDNNYLAFYDQKLLLFKILKNKIYLKTLDVPGINEIRFAYIFKNGNILFTDYTNAYYSHDNLTTFHKSDILDIDGKKYSPNKYGNFFSLVIDGRQFIDNKEIRVWGNYATYGVWQPGISRSEQIQVWYTIDEGKTIKTAYKFGHNIPKLSARHVHAVNMCPWDNTFWVQTGDMKNECHWIQGKYNWKQDSWSWDVKASGDHMSYFKSTGFVFLDNYVFWADDSSDPEKHGIWKTPYSNLIANNIDIKLFEKVFDTDQKIISLYGNNKGFMIASQYFKSNDNKYKIFSTSDGGSTWLTKITAFQIVNIHPPNAFGQILGNYFVNQQTFEAVHFWDLAPSVFINSYLKKSQLSN